MGDTTSVGIQRLLEAALREFGPDWEVASECSPINAGDPNHWPSGTRSFQVTLRHRATGARKILGRRTAGDAAARCHRGLAQLVISAYGERNTDPIRRYFGEIGIAAPTPGQIASEIKHVAGTNLLPGAAPSRPWATFIDQIRADQSRWLVIVQRHNPALYQSFRQTLADVERAQVVIDSAVWPPTPGNPDLRNRPASDAARPAGATRDRSRARDSWLCPCPSRSWNYILQLLDTMSRTRT